MKINRILDFIEQSGCLINLTNNEDHLDNSVNEISQDYNQL